MNVTACLVTRGNVDISDILKSIPEDWERLVWDNRGTVWRVAPDLSHEVVSSLNRDVGVLGRYEAAIQYASSPVCFVQDDDCLLEEASFDALLSAYEPGRLVANMPPQYAVRYPDSALVGFGALFDRGLPERAFARYQAAYLGEELERPDVIFSALTPRTIIEAPFEHLPWATNGDRAFRQDGHTDARNRVLGMCRGIRDADDDRR